MPSHWYFDETHFRRELDAIWYRDWVCVGRQEDIARPGDYFVARIGDQRIIVTRAEDGSVRAFHNTCRHRGSILCRENKGRFHNNRIICPYHTWTFSTDGELLATPGRFDTDDFDPADYPLYGVHVDDWGGFVFINLSEQPASGLMEFLGEQPRYLANWPLADMRSVRQEIIPVACNWKIFWENYNECYHCPRVHPELCRVMPVYKQAVFDHADLPDWQPAFEGDMGFGSVGDGARTWTIGGRQVLPTIEGLTEQDIEMGVMFATVTASMYVVGHPDYVRCVRIVPTGPESIELVVDWMLPKDFRYEHDEEIESIFGLTRLVIQEDGEVCELNQRGLHSRRHEQGVLVPQEYELWKFHQWLRERLTEADNIGA